MFSGNLVVFLEKHKETAVPNDYGQKEITRDENILKEDFYLISLIIQV